MATFLRIGALADRLNIAVRTIHDRVRRDPHFPKPVKLGSAPQSPLGFVVSEVETYEMRLMAARGTQESFAPEFGAQANLQTAPRPKHGPDELAADLEQRNASRPEGGPGHYPSVTEAPHMSAPTPRMLPRKRGGMGR